jgi:hypothetical protein
MVDLHESFLRMRSLQEYSCSPSHSCGLSGIVTLDSKAVQRGMDLAMILLNMLIIQTIGLTGWDQLPA